jgi:hypothetical protein
MVFVSQDLRDTCVLEAKRGLWGTCMAQVVATCKAGDAGLSHEPSGMVQEFSLMNYYCI